MLCFIYTEIIFQPPPILESLVSPFPQPANTEESIIDVLKYSQKDMDAAIARVQAEVRPALCSMITRNTDIIKNSYEMSKSPEIKLNYFFFFK